MILSVTCRTVDRLNTPATLVQTGTYILLYTSVCVCVCIDPWYKA